MNCQRCQSKRVLVVYAHCSDCCSYGIGYAEHDGYVPRDLGIGGGDDVEIEVCLDCGQMQGEYPIKPSKLEQLDAEDEDD